MLVDHLEIVKEDDSVVGSDNTMGVFYYEVAHQLLLLAKGTVFAEEKPLWGGRYLHIRRAMDCLPL
jgi:hypothetical protein